MIKVEFLGGETIDAAYKKLQKESETHNDVAYGTFNNKIIYSTESLDEAYKKVTGKTKSEFDKEMEDWRRDYHRKEEEHKAQIPTLSKEYRDKARGLVREDKLKEWDEVVPIRLGDLYHGMELQQVLDVCEIMTDTKLPYAARLRKAYDLFMDAGHSGMSAGLTASMIREFCPDGEDVADAVMNFRFEKEKKGDDPGRRGRQGGIAYAVSKKAEEFQKGMEPPYDGDDIISAYETGFTEALNEVKAILIKYGAA